MPHTGPDSSQTAMPPPDITLIIRYSRPETIGRAMDSVLAQHWQDSTPLVEVLLIDATGRNHVPPELARRGLAANAEPQPTEVPNLSLRWFTRHQPLPRAQALQAGIDEAKGGILMFLDDDDTIDPHHMDKLFRGHLQAREETPTLAAVTTGVRFVRPDAQSDALITLHEWDTPLMPERMIIANQIPLIGFAASADVLRSCRIDTSLSIYEDWDLMLALSRTGPFVHLPGISANYFMNPSGSGVHDELTAAPVAQAIRQKWISRFQHSDFQKIGEEILRADQTVTRDRVRAAELSDIRKGLDECRLALALEQEQTTRLRQELQLITSSRSWRMTAPIRNLKKLWNRDAS